MWYHTIWFVFEWCRLMTPCRNLTHAYNIQHTKSYTWHHTDTINCLWSIPHLYSHMVWWQKKWSNPEKVSNMQETKADSNKWDQEGRAEKLWQSTLDPAILVSIMCHHKLHMTVVTSLTLHNFLISHSGGYNARSLLVLAPQCPAFTQ